MTDKHETVANVLEELRLQSAIYNTGPWADRIERAMAASAVPVESPPASVPDGWMPIESAPKDGTPLLLCATRHSRVFPDPEVVVGRYERGWWSGRDTLSFVTNWKPCPALANSQEGSP